MTRTISAKLQAFVNKCLRHILRIWWPNIISNEELWRQTDQEKIDVTIKRRKWQWIGHTLRRPPEDITKQSLDWNPAGKRKKRKTKDDVEEDHQSRG